MSSEHSDSQDQSATPRKIRTKLCISLLVCVVLLGLLHRQILRATYNFLTYEDQPRKVTRIVVSGVDRLGLDRVQQLIAEGQASGVLIAGRRPTRVEEMGLVRRTSDLIREELVARGVSDSLIEDLDTGAITTWQMLRALDDYLQQEEQTTLALVCPQHNSRQLRWLIDHTADESRAERYCVWTFPPGDFGADSWWKNRIALVKIASGYLRLIHVIGFGEGEFHSDNWSPDQYEQSIGTSSKKSAA